MSIYEKLANIQQELKAPKNQRNNFGNYNYRSCEDILEAVKPLLKNNKLILTLDDELVQIGERYYIKAIAKIIDIEKPYEEFDDIKAVNCITNVAYAREEETKKGMDGSQITGASSSYARKYALNGLFLIDDVKDSDTTNIGEEVTEEYAKNYTFTFGKYKDKKLTQVIEEDERYIDWLLKNEGTSQDIIKSIEILTGQVPPQTTDEDIELTKKFTDMLNESGQDLEQLLKHYKVEKLNKLTKEQKEEAIKIMQKKMSKGE